VKFGSVQAHKNDLETALDPYLKYHRAAYLSMRRTNWMRSKKHLSSSNRRKIPKPPCRYLLLFIGSSVFRCGDVMTGFKLTNNSQLSILVFYFYDAPSPGKIFEDFLAIPTTQGNVATQSFSDFILSLKFQPSRSAIHLCGGIRADTVHSMYFSSVPVTRYSPTLFDVFLNQTKVSLSFGPVYVERGI
jgi:hypothetical protein